MRDAGTNKSQVSGWLWWRKVALPGVFPYYVTGAITASGGSWNAAIAAEYVSFGQKRTIAGARSGAPILRGSHCAAAISNRTVLGIAIMAFLVTMVINRGVLAAASTGTAETQIPWLA